MSVRHFRSVTDFSPAEIRAVLELANKIKRKPKRYRKALRGQTLAMIFQKKSTRTRVSFEVGMFQLGGHALFLGSSDIQIGRGETIADTAKVISRYCDGIMARVYGHATIEELAEHATVPVINGLCDLEHPCQTLCDAATLVEKWSPPGTFDVGVLRGKTLCYVGDGNNMAHSLLDTGAALGMNVTIVAPVGYQPDAAIVARATLLGAQTGAVMTVTDDLQEGPRGADALYTDVWASMGQEDEHAQRLVAFAGYQVDAAMMARAHPEALFLHCLPAHRGEEVSAEVCDGPQSVIFDEAENRLHVQKAILVTLMG
ncbi:MAG: ornithine carbamoyltransferase [Myxococcales bacterium]|nr:ornithine carbamoyltransferase [Myxococcales bacterium]